MPPIPLTAGQPLVQSFPPGQARRYTLDLEPGEYLHLIVEQRGVDVAVRALDPAGRLLLRVDSPNDNQGAEDLFLVAATAGRHVFEVESSAETGGYEMRVQELRPATRRDRTRAAAAAAFSRGRLLDREGQGVPAAASYRQAAKLWGEVGDEAQEAWSSFRRGSLFVGDPVHGPESVEALERALGLFRRLGDRRREAFTLHYLGLVWDGMGKIEPASRGYEQALVLWRELGDLSSQEGSCLNNLAILRVSQGRLQDAIDLYSRAIGVWRAEKNGNSEAVTRTNLGILYARLGEGRLAVDQYRHALASLDRQREPSNLAQRAVTLNKLGDALVWMEGPEPALAVLRQALELQRRQHDSSSQAVTLNSIGLAQLRANRPYPALEAFRSAGKIFQRLKNRSAQALVLENLGIAYERLGFAGRARDSYEGGLALDPGGAGSMAALFGLARVARMEGKLDEAEHRMERVLDLVEGVRNQVWRPDLRASYQAARQEQYAFFIDLLAERHRREPERGHDARAFAISEQARARSLLDLLSAARARPAPEELRRLDSLSRRINDRHRELLASPRGIPSSKLEMELAALLENWRQESSTAGGPPRDAASSLSIREAQGLLDPDTLLLEYFLGEERSYVWAVTSSSSRLVTGLPKREEIEAVARRAYGRLVKSHLQTEEAMARQAAARLSRMVLGPVAGLLDRPRLAVVAHGALQSVPFAALPHPDGPDDPLILDHEVVNLPSASVLAALRAEAAGRPPARGLLAVVADPVVGPDDERLQALLPGRPVLAAAGGAAYLPRLPYAGREAEEILSLAGAGRILAASGFEASRDLVLSGRLSGFRILHFASHGLFDDIHPELSALALSAFDAAGRPTDGQLRAYEVSSLQLHADLVVLSACRTALGREVSGEGMIGLTQGFFHAGTPRLIVSLWDVDDRSTSELMRRFYLALLRDKLTPAQALRQAQIALLRGKPWRAPYYWAGFVLQGEWR